MLSSLRVCVCVVFDEGFLCSLSPLNVCTWSVMKDSCVCAFMFTCVCACVVFHEGFLCAFSLLHVCVCGL